MRDEMHCLTNCASSLYSLLYHRASADLRSNCELMQQLFALLETNTRKHGVRADLGVICLPGQHLSFYHG
jgi:hypothetical protein